MISNISEDDIDSEHFEDYLERNLVRAGSVKIHKINYAYRCGIYIKKVQNRKDKEIEVVKAKYKNEAEDKEIELQQKLK